MTDLPERALSIRQPWAWAIIHGGKDIENRSAPAVGHMHIRAGEDTRIAVHAAKGMTQDEYTSCRDFMATIGVECPPAADLLRGGVIGIVTIKSVVTSSESPWFFGPRGLVLSDAEAVEPIACAGALGTFLWGRAIRDEFDTPKPWMLRAAGRDLPEKQGTLI